MDPVFTTLGATIGLVLAIALVLLRMQPAYALMAGALVGGLAGGGGRAATMAHAVSGAQGMTPAILRILASGVLAGALIKTGSAERIARAIVDNPDAVTVEETVEGNDVTLVLRVADDDTGMVIGRKGRIARAIRSLMKAAGNTEGKKVNVEIE